LEYLVFLELMDTPDTLVSLDLEVFQERMDVTEQEERWVPQECQGNTEALD